MHSFCPFCKKKTCFFYFTHPLLQNTHISLFILHIYSIKYSFLTQYLATINDQSSSNHQPSLHHQPTQPPSSSQPHQPTDQNPKTTDQNHQNPLIKIIKPTNQNHHTKKKDSGKINPFTRNKGQEIKQWEASWRSMRSSCWLVIGEAFMAIDERSNSKRSVKV